MQSCSIIRRENEDRLEEWLVVMPQFAGPFLVRINIEALNRSGPLCTASYWQGEWVHIDTQRDLELDKAELMRSVAAVFGEYVEGSDETRHQR